MSFEMRDKNCPFGISSVSYFPCLISYILGPPRDTFCDYFSLPLPGLTDLDRIIEGQALAHRSVEHLLGSLPLGHTIQKLLKKSY